MAVNNSHLERGDVPVSETVRDRIREELGTYAYGAVMLDGVTIDKHNSVVVNTPYYIEFGNSQQQLAEPEHETLF